jgi:hypothetical protein
LEDLTVFPHCLPSQDFPQYDFFHVLKGALKSEGFTTLFTFIGFLPPPSEFFPVLEKNWKN